MIANQHELEKKPPCLRNSIIFCLCLDGCSKFAPREMMLCEFEADAE